MIMVRMKKILLPTLALLLATGSFSCLWANSDLLTRPAITLKSPTDAVYMDVTRAGERLVAVGELGLIVYSDDHGQSWQQAAVPVSVNLTAVDFVGEQKGWAVGHDGVLLHSTDGGASWQKLYDGNDFNRIALDAMTRVVKEFEARLASAEEAERADLEIELEDLSFQLEDAQFAVDDGPIRPFMDVWFANQHEGLIVGAFGMIFSTADGGKSWKPLNTAIDNPEGYHYYGLAKTRNALIMVGETGILYRSFDQGRSWETLVSPYEGSLFGIVGDENGDRALAVGLRGNVVEITADGETLRHLKTPIPVSLNSGILNDNGNWLLVGLAGQALVQNADTNAFIPISTKFPGCLSVASTADEQFVLAGLIGLKRMKINP